MHRGDLHHAAQGHPGAIWGRAFLKGARCLGRGIWDWGLGFKGFLGLGFRVQGLGLLGIRV